MFVHPEYPGGSQSPRLKCGGAKGGFQWLLPPEVVKLRVTALTVIQPHLNFILTTHSCSYASNGTEPVHQR